MVGAVGVQKCRPPPRIPEIDEEHNCRRRLKAVQPTRNLVVPEAAVGALCLPFAPETVTGASTVRQAVSSDVTASEGIMT